MNDAEREKYHGKSLFQWLVSRKFWIYSSSIFFILFICSFIALQYWAHNHFRAIVEDDMQYGELKELLAKTTDYPEEYRIKIPRSNAMGDVYQRLSNIDVQLNLTERIYNIDWKTKSDEELEKLLDEFDPYIEAGIELAKEIESAIQNCKPGTPLPILNPRDIDNLLIERATFRIYKKQYDEALRDAIYAILLSVECPFRYFQDYVRGLTQIRAIVENKAEPVAPFVQSKTGLKDSLQTLNRIEPVLFQELSHLAETLSLMNLFDTHYKDHYEPGKKWEFYFDRKMENALPTYVKREFVELQVHLYNRTKPSDLEIAIWMRPLALSHYVNDFIRLYYYKRSIFLVEPIHSDIKTQQAETGVAFDRLRLKIAARLYELETGKKVSATTELVPEYFPKEIKDRQSGESFIWSENGELMGY